MQHLRQSTASQEISLGYFVDSTDGNTEETGLTIANTDIKLRKHGGTTLTNKNSGGGTHISNGIYYATLDATDTNTAGMLEIYSHVSGALPVKSVYMVLTATAFDALYTGTFNNISTTEVNTECDTALTDYDPPTNAEMEARTLVAASYFDPAADTVANVTTVATLTGHTAQTGDSFALIGTAGAGLTNINLPNQTMDITGNITGNLSGSVGSVTNDVTIDAASVDLIWDEPVAGHLTAGTTGLSEALGATAIIDTTVTGTPTSTTIDLTAGSAIDDFYNDQAIYVLSGTGIGQVRIITDYTGSTKTVTLDEAWVTTPAAADRVCVLVSHTHPITQIQSGLATEAKQDTAQSDLDIITGADGVNLLSATQASIDAIEVDTNSLNDTKIPNTLNTTASGNIGIDWANVENPTTALDLSGTDIQLCDTTTTNTDMVAAAPTVASILTTQMTESYASDGTAPTLAQALFLIQQSLGDFSISGTTITTKKLDGSTTAATYTLDDGTSPTSRTRAT